MEEYNTYGATILVGGWPFICKASFEDSAERRLMRMTISDLIAVIGFTVTIFSLGYEIGLAQKKNDRR